MQRIIHSITELKQVASWVLNAAPDKRVFVFYAPMGTGKTSLIKAICEQLGVQEATSSPSFSIVNEYLGESGSIFHFDFYRLEDQSEAYDLGYEEYFYSGNYCFIEWPEKIPDLIPEDALRIEMELLDDQKRKITLF